MMRVSLCNGPMTTPAQRVERVLLWTGAGLCIAAAFSMRVALSGGCTDGCMPPTEAYPLLGSGLILILIAGEAMTKRRNGRASALLHSWFPDENEAVTAMRVEAAELEKFDEQRLADSWARLEEQHLTERQQEE